MFGHMNTIIGEDKAYRKIGFFGPPWPAHYLAIGGDGFGNLYFLDLSRGDETVLFADHDATSEFDGIDMYEEAPNLAEWITGLRRAETYYLIRGIAMQFTLTPVFQQVPEGYIGFVKELLGANTQGETLAEARANLQETIALVLEANRLLTEEKMHG